MTFKENTALLIDLRLEGKTAVLFGGGRTAERKVKKLLDQGARINVVSRSFTESLLELGEKGEIELIEADLDEAPSVIPDCVTDADVVIAATDSQRLNALVSKAARDEGALVCAVDMPELCDFYFPAVAQKGSIRVGVCTDGKSPLMSKLIKEKIQAVLTDEDALGVDLQAYARGIAKTKITGSRNRRDALYSVAQDSEVQRSLADGNLPGAEEIARKIIEEWPIAIDESTESNGV
jgi:siroheme synthase-like protein